MGLGPSAKEGAEGETGQGERGRRDSREEQEANGSCRDELGTARPQATDSGGLRVERRERQHRIIKFRGKTGGKGVVDLAFFGALCIAL